MIELRRKDGSDPSLSHFLQPRHLDLITEAAMDDVEHLTSPTNAIKIKYDIQKCCNIKWDTNAKHPSLDASTAEICINLDRLFTMEWKETVSRLARSILASRKLTAELTMSSPADIETLHTVTVKKMKALDFDRKHLDVYRAAVIAVQARILLYNKRRSGEIDAIT